MIQLRLYWFSVFSSTDFVSALFSGVESSSVCLSRPIYSACSVCSALVPPRAVPVQLVEAILCVQYIQLVQYAWRVYFICLVQYASRVQYIHGVQCLVLAGGLARRRPQRRTSHGATLADPRRLGGSLEHSPLGPASVWRPWKRPRGVVTQISDSQPWF